MRVLGIDPGLTRCGLGVVDGSVGRPLSLVDVNVLRTSADRPVPERLVTILSGIEAWLDEFQPDAVAVERVFARSDSSTIMGTAQASGIAMVCAARRGLPIALHTPSRGQGRRVGQRSRRQGPGRRHGHPDPGAVASSRSPPTPPTRWRWPSPTSGAAGHRPASMPRWPDTGEVHDRVRPRRGRRGHLVQRRARRRRRRARAAVHAGHPGHPARRPAGHAAHEHGGPRGVADAVRLPRRRREVGLRARPDRLRRRARSWPSRSSPSCRPTSCAPRSPTRTSRP